MKKLVQYGSWIAAIVLLGLSPALMGPSGGFPSRPTFQTVNVNGAGTGTIPSLGLTSTQPLVKWNETDAAVDARRWILYPATGIWQLCALNDAEAATACALRITRGGGSPSIAVLDFGNATDNPTYNFLGTGVSSFGGPTVTIANGGAAPRFVVNDTTATGSASFGTQKNGTFSAFFCEAHAVNQCSTGAAANDMVLRNDAGTTLKFSAGGGSVTDMTPLSGNFVASFDDSCTTTPTITFGYKAIGGMVTVWPESTSGFPCTSDSTNFATTATPVPAAIRPAVAASTGCVTGFTDNGTATIGQYTIAAGGTVSANKASTTTTCAAVWTGSGNKNAAITGIPLSYGLGTP